MFSQNLINVMYSMIKDAMENGIECNEDYSIFVDLKSLEVSNSRFDECIEFEKFDKDWSQERAKAVIEIVLNNYYQ